MQLDVSSSQLLVTDSDFENPNFRERLCETVESLLDLKVVPLFNENDAISTRKAPYEVRVVPFSNFACWGIFAACFKCGYCCRALGRLDFNKRMRENMVLFSLHGIKSYSILL
jgi:hypothetical protein